jgi:hypothetical protein
MTHTASAILALILTAQLAICGDTKKEDEARAALEMAKVKAKANKPDKEEFTSLETAKSIARVTGKDCVLVRYGDFQCLDVCPKVKGAVRCRLPKDAGKERLRVLVFNDSNDGWYYEDIETKPTQCHEIEGVMRGLRERLGVKVKAESAKTIDWDF